jgi:hypothetical protein
MTHQVQWTTNLQISGGPAFSLPGSIAVDAYDDISVTVKKGQKSAQVDLPGAAGQVQLVLITSDYVDPKLTYTVKGATTPIALDATQLLVGAGAVALLGSPPLSITIDNTKGAQDASLQILIGRNTSSAP